MRAELEALSPSFHLPSLPWSTRADKPGTRRKDMTRKIALIAAAVLALAALTAGIAVAASGDDDAADKPIAGVALDRAKAAALAHTGGGRITGTEVGDEESYYEVEVTLENGSQVDVQLDKGFNVVGSENDGQEDED
jgi:uncharacterized membrane protein YkoI